MRIGILYDDGGSKGLNLSRPDKGNPGVGGSQFCFLMLVYYLRFYKDYEITLYHTNDNHNIFCNGITVKLVTDINLLIGQCVDDNIDILLINFSRLKQLNDDIKKYMIKTIAWVHNFISLDFMKMVNNNDYVKRIVFVGKEQYDRYIDDPLIEKSVCIFNMFNSELPGYQRLYKLKPIVTYTGALIPGKGFHMLAREWKHIVNKVPNAELYIIGNGKLYNRNAKLGKYGIASEEYEQRFMKFITDETGSILPSVHFMGILGDEKNKIYQMTKVGVINPTARTEICSISSIEMEACGIPVISKFKNGMPDVIANNRTGILVKSCKQMRKSIVKLLNNNELNGLYSKNAKRYVNDKFSPKKITEQWYNLFQDVYYNRETVFEKPCTNWTNNFKWIRAINRQIRKKFGFLPSIAFIECKIAYIIGRG